MLVPREAMMVGWHLAAIRSYYALARFGNRVTYRVLEELGSTAPKVQALATLVPPGDVAYEAPANEGEATRLQERVVAKAVTMVHPGGLAERTLGLSLGFVEVIVTARTADHLGLLLGLEAQKAGLLTATKPVEEALVATLPVLASARESLTAAVERFIAGWTNDEVSPAVREAGESLLQAVRDEPPRFDAWKTAQPGRPGEAWCKRLVERARRTLATLAFPAEPPVDPNVSPAESALLAAIMANPADDALRTRWAELAVARHDMRGALVRAPVDSELAAFLARTHPEWGDDVRALGAEAPVVARGFVESIRITADTFLENAALLRRTAPLRHLVLTGVAAHLDALLSSRMLDGFVWLDLRGQGLNDAHIQKIADAPLPGLLALSLESNAVTDAGVRLLWASRARSSLLYCGLEGNPCTPLASWELTPQEMSTYEWLPTDRAMELQAELGARRWAVPWSSTWPPTLGMLVSEPTA